VRLRGPAILVAMLCGVAIAACGTDEADPQATATEGAAPTEGTAERLAIPGSGEALLWGGGTEAVVLAHGAAFDAASWEPQAEAIAAQGQLVLAVEEIGAEEILAAVEYLRAERSARSVALIGASAGADASLRALSAEPEAVDQLITLSVNSTAEGLGEEPKLFIASEDESVAALSAELAASADGSENEALLLAGSAHAQAIFDGFEGATALEAILERLASGGG
jgi:pimeloyl-ACP methyl ester carboxylesterase